MVPSKDGIFGTRKWIGTSLFITASARGWKPLGGSPIAFPSKHLQFDTWFYIIAWLTSAPLLISSFCCRKMSCACNASSATLFASSFQWHRKSRALNASFAILLKSLPFLLISAIKVSNINGTTGIPNVEWLFIIPLILSKKQCKTRAMGKVLPQPLNGCQNVLVTRSHLGFS